MVDLDRLAVQLRTGEISGNDLKEKVERNEINKNERRKITKLSKQLGKRDSLTPRQLLRIEVKEKKSLPKVSRDDRKRKYHEEIERERQQQEANFTVCLGCRKRGHFVKDCPRLSMSSMQDRQQQQQLCGELCFNCGSFDHTLKNCPVPRKRNGELAFANCFICKQTGHISRDCPENPNGLYPKGGCCHICYQKNHLAKDCPDRQVEPVDQQESTYKSKFVNSEDGVIVKGLAVTEGNNFGDDLLLDEPEYNNEEEDGSGDEDGKKKKKSKKRRKH
jgi:hypothetical protein